MAGLTAAFGFPYSSQFLLSGHSCCDSGTGLRRSPPHTPTTTHVCSCQLEQVLQQKMNAAALPLGLLPRANFSTEQSLLFGPTPRESSTMYQPLVRQCDMKEMNSTGTGFTWYANPARFGDHHNFDQSNYLACHRFGDRFSPIDLNSGARRKNATRETTSTLKAWLYEHRKNPYPTKGEKIMLAILTKMTLTQVSTWFANARRRLKKENKMTWSPRNRCGERKDSEGYSDDEDVDEDEKMEDLTEKLESLPCRQTTVIKSAEDTSKVWRGDHAVMSRLTGKTEATFTTEQQRCVTIPAQHRTDERIIWSNARSPTETERASPAAQHASSSMEDSPVKSLRKWVDGCFHEDRTARSPLTDTPPLTPPSETERLTEKLIHSTKKQTLSPSRESPAPTTLDVSHVKETEESDNESEATSNREIDAALALTTLFSRS